MFLAYLTLLTALTISAVAIYYSVAGLAAIFAAAVIPIVIMGTVLEVSKLVTAIWLHKYWGKCVWWLKTYLSIAVLVLMFITSMGIFGFLSRAHIEQTSMTGNQLAEIEILEDQLLRSESKLARWTEETDRLLRGEDVRVDTLIEREQTDLDNLYARINQEKAQLRQDAERQIELQNNRLAQAQQRKQEDVLIAQQRWASSDNAEQLDQAIQRATANELSVASAVQREIVSINSGLAERLESIDQRYAEQIASFQNNISSLRNQSSDKTADIDSRLADLDQIIQQEQTVLGELREEKAILERDYRKLEAEVGPIKYIAEFIYGESADKDLLEEAVRWVIVIIIFVFDPLAVLLLIASQYTFGFHREDSKVLVETVPLVDKPKEKPADDSQKSKPLEEVAESYLESESKKKDLVVRPRPKTESDREAAYKLAEQTQSWADAKTAWKADHPTETLKEHKRKYIRGQIEELPWERYIQNSEQNKTSLWQQLQDAQNNNNNTAR